jgi:hypothetical protein
MRGLSVVRATGSASASACTRALASMPPPAAKGTISVMFLAGQSWAGARVASRASAPSATAKGLKFSVFWKSCGSFWAVAPVNARFGAPA